MTERKLTIITFSPTGGTQKCAEALAKGIGDIDICIDLTKRDLSIIELSPNDTAVIAVPSYGGRMPALAAERLRSIKANGAKAIILTVYGNRAYEDTLTELEDLAKACGFNVIAAVSAVARHSIVNKIATERPDSEDIKILAEFGKQIKSKIESGNLGSPAIPGNRPYKKAGSAMAPKTNKNCNGCGKCVVLCPSGAINKDNPRKVDTKVCINCMRCVEICSNDAKYIPSLMLWLVGQVLKKPCATRNAPELFV